MRRALAAAATLAAMGLSACGDGGEGPPSASPATSAPNAVEDRVEHACDGHSDVAQFAMATEVSGYGSQTDYWLVLCGDGLVAPRTASARLLAAFPRTGREERRSGTWATIRRGVAANLDVRLWPLIEVDR